MGWSFRRRVRLGKGLSINFSNSGVSVSAGIPGLRTTKGIIGKRKKTSLYAGLGGFYYRKTLSPSQKKVPTSEPNPQPVIELQSNKRPDNTDWASACKLRDIAFEQMNKRRFNEAEKTLNKALKVAKNLGGGILYDLLGDIYLERKDYKRALKMYYTSLRVHSTEEKRKRIMKITKLSNGPS